MVKRAGLVLTIVVGIALALVVAALLLVHTPYARRYALDKAIAALKQQNIDLRARDLRYNLADGRISMDSVTLRSTAALDLPPVLTVDHVEAEVDIAELLTGSYHVEVARVVRPNIRILLTKDGRSNIPRPPEEQQKTQDKSALPDFLIDKAEVSGARLAYEDRANDVALDLPQWQLAITGHPRERTHDVQLTTMRAGRLQLAGRTAPIEVVNVDAVLARDYIQARGVRLEAAGSRVHVTGRVQDFNDPQLDLRTSLEADLRTLSQLSGLKQRLAGSVAAEIIARGRTRELVAEADVVGRSITYESLRGVEMSAKANYSAADARVTVEPLRVSSPAGALYAAGAIPSRPDGAGQLHTRLQNIDLQRLSKLFGSKVVIASRATGEADLRWRGRDYRNASGTANIVLRPSLRSAAKNEVPIAGMVAASSERGQLTVATNDLRLLGAQISAGVQSSELRTLAGNVRIQIAEPQNTIAEVNAFQGNTGKAPPIRGAIVVTAVLDGTVKAPLVNARLDAPDLAISRVQPLQLSAEVRYTPTLVEIKQADLHLQGEHAWAQGRIGMTGVRPIELRGGAQNLSISNLLVLAGRDLPVSGTLNAQAAVSGTQKAPVGNINVVVDGLKAYGEPFGNLNARVEAINQNVHLREMTLVKPGPDRLEELRVGGNFNIPTRRYSFEVGGTGLTLHQFVLADGTPIRGKVGLKGNGQGTLQNPSLALQLNADDLRIREQQVGDINATLTVANQRAQVAARIPDFALASIADLGIKAPYPTHFRVTADGTDLGKLPIAPEKRPEGRLTAAVEGRMNASEWRRGAFSLRVQPLDLRWKEQRIRSEGPIVATYANQVLRIDAATLHGPGSVLQIAGTLPFEKANHRGDIRLSARGDLAVLSALFAADPRTKAHGNVTFDARLTGNLERLRPAASLRVENASVATATLQPAVTGINVDLIADDSLINLRSANARWADATLRARAAVPLTSLPFQLPIPARRAASPAMLSVDVERLNLGTVPGVPSNIKGTVSLHAEASAPGKVRFDTLRGGITLPELKLNLNGLPVEQQGISTITLAGGQVRVDRFALTGPTTNVRLAGLVDLTGSRQLNLTLDAGVDLGVVASFAEGIRAQGPARAQLRLAGTTSQPDLRGFVELNNAQANLTSPPVFADGLNVRVEATGNRVSLARLDGTLNGGRLSGSGGLSLTKGTLQDVDLRVGARNVFMNFPEGFRTASTSDLRFYKEGETLVLGGKVRLLEAAYTDPITVTGNFTRYLRSGDTVEFTRERNPLLARIRYNLDIDTASPIVIDNNLAELEATADLQLVGTYYRPSVTGRVSIAQGGQLLLNERRYVIDRGVLTFINEQRIEPALDIVATTEASGYDITLRVEGEVGKTETNFTSDPALPEPDIISVLLTGRTLEEARGSQTDVAREQVLALLAGGATGEISAGLQRATGLSLVRLEPSLIASEEDPTARLTVGQDVTRNLSLVYSVDLRNSNDQIYMAEWDLTKRFTTRAVKEADNTYRFEFRHDLRFGGPGEDPRLTKQRKPKVASVDFVGNRYFTDRDLLDEFGVKPGKDYDFFKVRKGLDGLEELYADKDLLESRFQLDRRIAQGKVDLSLKVQPGPIVKFTFHGPVGRGVRKQVREIWQKGVFDAQRRADSEQVIRNALVKEGYLRGRITSTVAMTANEKHVTFTVVPGARYRDVRLEFQGAQAFSRDELLEALEDADLMEELYTEPDKITGYLQRFYAEAGYLDAEVSPRGFELDDQRRTGRVLIPIKEGPLYRVADVRFTGNQFVDSATLKNAVLLAPGEVYKPELRDRSYDKILDLYLEQGFREVEIDPALETRADAGEVDVIFNVKENKQQVVTAITINGTEETSPSLVHSQLAFEKGDVLSSTKLTESRRKLYRTGAFFVVDVDAQPAKDATGLKPYQVPVNMAVEVQELPAYEIRYGASFDTDRGVGGVLDLANRNTLGKARVIGMSIRADRLFQENRIYFSQPQLTRFPLKTDASVYFNRQDRDLFRTDRLGFAFQQESRWGNYYIYSFGYRNERTRSYATSDPALRFTERVAPITAALTREKRDDILDAHQGSFMSHAFEYGDGWLGSGLKFYRYFGQYSNYLPLSRPEPLPFSAGVKKSRFVYAASVRLGVGGGLRGQTLLPSERFFAGGGTTVRGFENDSLGPRDPITGLPTGGDAMFVLNNEIRFPMIKMFEGVAFVDVGNVYASVSDFRPWDVRKAAGAGLRVRTPYFLLRADYGFKLDRKPGESAGKFFISIGQAF